MKNVKTNRGITLIALVVTIIVLLILAAVTIGLVLGQNGIIGKANKAKNAADIATGKDQVQLALTKVVSDKLEDGKTTSDIKAEDLQTELQKTDSSASVTGTNPDFTAKYHVSEIEYEYKINTEKQMVAESSTTEVAYSELSIGDYVNYPVYYENTESHGLIAADKFSGWRILSIEGSGENSYVRLISAGFPLSYIHDYGHQASTCVENLTTNFFQTEINTSTVTNNKFYNCGFKTEGTYIENMESVKNLFINEYTATNVEGYPKVQSMTKDDVDKVLGSVSSNESYVNGEKYNDLLAVPCKDETSKYALTWLATEGSGTYLLYSIFSDGKVSESSAGYYGIRPVISLKTNVKFKEATTKINDTTTWNISI